MPATAGSNKSELPLKGGSNEFGVWAGYSPDSIIIEGQTRNRRLFLLNLQYARALFATRPVTLKYTAEIVPIALENQPRQFSLVNGEIVSHPASTAYGAGAGPLGLQVNFGPKRIQPFANASLGFLYFDQQVPVLKSSQFNFTMSVGFGVQIFPHSGRSFTLGWKYHHLSNASIAPRNPGIDSSVFYAGFSVYRKK